MQTVRVGGDLPVRSPTVLVVEDELLMCMMKPTTTWTSSSPTCRCPGALMVLGLAAWIRRERPGVKVILTSGVPGAAAMAREPGEGGAAAISHARRPQIVGGREPQGRKQSRGVNCNRRDSPPIE